MYLFKQVKRNVRGHFTTSTWRQPPSSSISREQSHSGHRGLTDVESEQENPSRKSMQMKERKDRLCVLFSPSSSSLPSNNVSWAGTACRAPAGRGPWRIWHSSSVPTAPMWVLLDVCTSPSKSQRLLLISGQKNVFQEWQETVFQEHQETARHSKDGLSHLLQHGISYEHMDKAFWCFPPATGDMGGHLPSAAKGPRATGLVRCRAWWGPAENSFFFFTAET